MQTVILIMRACVKCEELKDDTCFRLVRKFYRRRKCVECENGERGARDLLNPKSYIRRSNYTQEKEKTSRRSNTNTPKWIFVDSKKNDRKHGRPSDLDVIWITKAIEGGCTYCDETEIRMTLDRIDNCIGHIKSNVVACCERCNYLRRDMPWAAWQLLVPTIKEARKSGAFGTWIGGIKRRHSAGKALQ